MEMCETPREVFENMLLVALDDASKVAIVASEDDLNLLISGLDQIKHLKAYSGASQMAEDLRTLRNAAFCP